MGRRSGADAAFSPCAGRAVVIEFHRTCDPGHRTGTIARTTKRSFCAAAFALLAAPFGDHRPRLGTWNFRLSRIPAPRDATAADTVFGYLGRGRCDSSTE